MMLSKETLTVCNHEVIKEFIMLADQVDIRNLWILIITDFNKKHKNFLYKVLKLISNYFRLFFLNIIKEIMAQLLSYLLHVHAKKFMDCSKHLKMKLELFICLFVYF